MGLSEDCLATAEPLRFSVARLRLCHFFIGEDKKMNLYESLYYELFAAIADAVESLEQDEPIAARKALISVMRDAEEAVILSEA